METKFTKGPWFWQDFGSGLMLIAGHGHRAVILAANRDKLVTSKKGRLQIIEGDESELDLIEAAPDLFAALQAVLEEHKEGYGLNCLEQVKSALAKAAGVESEKGSGK